MLTAAYSADELAQLRGATAQWWKDYWTASAIDLPGQPEVMRYYYGAQYLFASTSRAGREAPGLFGIWHTTDNPSWAGDFRLNYNFIATFYGANLSNRSEFSLPAVEAMLGFVQAGKQRAADPEQLRRISSTYIDSRPDLQGGIKGAVLYPVGIGPRDAVTDDAYHNEALNASYSSYPLIQYFLYTEDEQYLDEKVYDFLVLCVKFYDAWVDKTEKPFTLYAGYNEGSWAINPAVELAALKNVLESVIDASVVLDRDVEKRAHWQDILDNLAEQPTSIWNDKKVYSLAEQEWRNNQWQDLANPVPGGGNIIPLDIVVPGNQLGYYSTAEEHETARNTIDVFGDGAWRLINNFPRIFNDAVQTCCPAEGVLRNLTETINRQIQPNLRISDGAHGVEKIGAMAAVNNMLLMTDKGVTKVFPNWLADESAAFPTLRAEGAFLFSAACDGESQVIIDITVFSEPGKSLTIASPWSEGVDVYDAEGELILTSEGTAPNWEEEVTYTFETVAGESYTLKPFAEKPETLGDGTGADGETPGDGTGGQKPGKDDGKIEDVTGETDKDLAKTGANVSGLVGVGLITLLAGAGLIYNRRRSQV